MNFASRVFRQKAGSATVVVEHQDAIPRLEDCAEVTEARRRQDGAARDLAAARERVSTLQAELKDPKRTRSEARIRVEVEDAEQVIGDRQIALTQAIAARKTVEERFRDDVIRPAIRAQLEPAVRELYAALRDANPMNERVRQLEELERELFGASRCGFTFAWPELSASGPGASRLQNMPQLARQELGIDL